MKLNWRAYLIMCLVFLPLFAVKASTSPAEKPKAVWIEDVDEAFKIAAKQKKPVFINFTGSDWCYWCILADKNIFSNEKWAEFSKKMVCLKVDFPRQTNIAPEVKAKRYQFAKVFGVRGFPTFVLATPERAEIARFSAGKKSAEDFIAEVTKVLEKK